MTTLNHTRIQTKIMAGESESGARGARSTWCGREMKVLENNKQSKKTTSNAWFPGRRKSTASLGCRVWLFGSCHWYTSLTSPLLPVLLKVIQTLINIYLLNDSCHQNGQPLSSSTWLCVLLGTKRRSRPKSHFSPLPFIFLTLPSSYLCT